MTGKADDERDDNGVTQADLRAIQQRRIEQAEYRQAERSLNMLRARDLGRMLKERDG